MLPLLTINKHPVTGIIKLANGGRFYQNFPSSPKVQQYSEIRTYMPWYFRSCNTLNTAKDKELIINTIVFTCTLVLFPYNYYLSVLIFSPVIYSYLCVMYFSLNNKYPINHHFPYICLQFLVILLNVYTACTRDNLARRKCWLVKEQACGTSWYMVVASDPTLLILHSHFSLSHY